MAIAHLVTVDSSHRCYSSSPVAHARDINESDTVVIITDVLQYGLGYDVNPVN